MGSTKKPVPAGTEKVKRLEPLSATVRQLWLLSGNQCTMPECDNRIEAGNGVYIGKIAHISGANPGGPRFDPKRTNEERRAFGNLILVCGNCHDIIDQDVATWTEQRLLRVKRDHELRNERDLDAGLSDLAERLPAFLYEEMLAAKAETPRIVELGHLIARSPSPAAELSDWAEHTPSWLRNAPASAWLTFARALSAYGHSTHAANAIGRALDDGATPRGYWLAQQALLIQQSDLDRSRSLVDAAGGSHSMPLALSELWAGRSRQALAHLDRWNPVTRRDLDLKAILASACLQQVGDTARSVEVLEEALSESPSGQVPLQLARVLLHQVLVGVAVNVQESLDRAARNAILSRDRLRVWRGDSVAPAVVASHAFMQMHDWSSMLRISTAEPDGEATLAEAQDVRLAGRAAIAAAMAGRDGLARTLAHSSGPFDRAAVLALLEERAVSTDSAESVDLMWQEAWRAASSDEEILTAARGILLSGGSLPDVSSLSDELRSAIGRSQELAHALGVQGPPVSRDEVVARLEIARYDHEYAALQLADIYQRDGELTTAARILEEAADHFDEQLFRLYGASMMLESAEYELATQMATDALARTTSTWHGRPRATLTLCQAAFSSARWTEAAAHARQLLVIDSFRPEATSILAEALFNLDESQKAWSLLKPADKAFVPQNRLQGLLVLQLCRRHGTRSELLSLAAHLLEMYTDDPDLRAAIVGITVMPTVSLDAEPGTEDDQLGPVSDEDERNAGVVRAALESLKRHAPDHPEFSVIPTDDETQLVERMKARMRPGAAQQIEVFEKAQAGEIPLAVLSRFTGKTYMELLLRNGVGYLHAGSSDQQEVAAEMATVRELLAGRTPVSGPILDQSVLNLLTLMETSTAEKVRGRVSGCRITDFAKRDVMDARDSLALLSTRFLGYDPRADQLIFTESSLEKARELSLRSKRAVDFAKRCTVVVHRQATKLQRSNVPPSSIWANALDACIANRYAYWCDDVLLRRIARQEGIPTFGTLALMTVLATDGALTQDEVNLARETLVSCRIVDIQLQSGVLETIAAQEGWDIAGAAVCLTRPSTWESPEEAMRVLLKACHVNQAQPARLQSWITHAAYGIVRLPVPHTITSENLVKLLNAILGQGTTSPPALRAALSGIRIAADGRPVTDPWLAASKNLHRALLRAHGEAAAANISLAMASTLDEADRQALASVIVSTDR